MSHLSWKNTNADILRSADSAQQQSQNERAQTVDLMRTHSSELQRTQREVQHKLALRIDDIELRKQDLTFAINNSEAEIAELEAYKAHVESVIKAKDSPLAVSNECLQGRKQRQGADLFHDDVDAKLETEVALLHRVQDLFRAKHAEVVEQLRLLRAALFQLREDLKDKSVSHSIDNKCVQLDSTGNVGLFRETVRATTTGKAAQPAEWDQFTDTNITRSVAEVKKSVALRLQLDAHLKDTADDLLCASNKVEDAFNARLAEYNDARNAAMQKLAKTQQEIAVQDRNIAELRDAIASRDGPLRLATTRLEKRQQRPNIELVRDPAQHALVSEVGALDLSVDQLQTKLADAEETLRALLRAENALHDDVAINTNSINIDNACMLSRQKLKYAPIVA